MKTVVYADHAATSPLDEKALEAMLPFLKGAFGNASQVYSLGRSARKAIEDARQKIAECINANPSEIYFTSGGTESNNWILKSASALHMNIVSSAIEHPSIRQVVTRLSNTKCAEIPVEPSGSIDLSALKMQMQTNSSSGRQSLISVMRANNETGILQPIESIVEIAHVYQARVHTDAVQAIGHIPVDMHALDVDYLSASAHKFNGPKGIGFLAIRQGAPILSLLNGGAQEASLRAGTENVASIVGMAVALQNNIQSLETNAKHLRKLEEICFQIWQDNAIPYTLNGKGNRIPGVLSVGFNQGNGEGLMHQLDLMGCCISTGSACNQVKTQISHVLTAMQVPPNVAQSTIRISFGKENTQDDAIKLASSIVKALKLGRK